MKYKITIKCKTGEITANDTHTDEFFPLKYIPDGVENIKDDIEFSKYNSLNTSGGYIQFKSIDNVLYTIVEFYSEKKLTPTEIGMLVKETSGQLSDGIGEGFAQQPCLTLEDRIDVYIDPWYYGSKFTAKQEEV